MTRALLAFVAALAGCQDSQGSRAPCLDDTDCPSGTWCHMESGACVDPPDCVPTEATGGAEFCDGVDNDCDGVVDERGDLAAAAIVGVLCGVSEGMCEHGILECEAGELVCASSVGAEEERCDGLDNDCDGIVDNGFDLGAACSAGAGSCLSRGVMVCGPDGRGTTCSAPERAPDFEECDGVDNDCDGETDEKFGLGGACSEGLGVCETEGVVVCDAQGRGRCNALPPEGGEESCDGLDNDCDGRTDEDFGVGSPCEVGVGQCRALGTTRCGQGGKAECEAATGRPAEEVCDDLDNDCDGDIDEGFFVGLGCEAGVGACRREGAMLCVEGAVVCSAEAEVAAFEVCDGVDNDCDGAQDEGFEVGGPCEAGQGDCRALGVWACDDAGGRVCGARVGVAALERCDGADNDCDGEADERFPVGEVCHQGRGECRSPGVRVCAGDFGTRCNGRPFDPRAEACDGLDNDCDGDVDEDFDLGLPCVEGLGVCQEIGERECDRAGGVRCSARPGRPADEVCDGADNDCDGDADEDYSLGDACALGVGACRSAGVRVCDEVGGAACSAIPAQPSADVCDGADNDCDGSVDEAGVDLLAGCELPPGGAASCGEGRCVFACEEGRRDVDGDFGDAGGNGCEGRDWAALEAGVYFSCGLLTDGSLKCWGANDQGQSDPPQGVYDALSVGSYHACAVDRDSQPHCWGRDQNGQASAPVGVPMTHIAAGSRHTCGLRRDGTVRCWGSNTHGQLSPPLGERFTELGAGGEHTCGLHVDGRLRCWGSNANGQREIPVGEFSGLAVGSNHTCGVRADGSLACWGLNLDGQSTVPEALLGVEVSGVSAAYRNTCAVTHEGGLVCWGAPNFGQLPTPEGLTWQRVGVGRYHTCGVPDSERVRCWGANDFAQGDPPDGAFTEVVGGRLHFCGLRVDGRVECWGDDGDGQSTPPVGTYTMITAGEDYTCALAEDRRIRCWGEARGRPMVAPGGHWRSVTAGGDFVCALDDLGHARCWGGDMAGQLRPPLVAFGQLALGGSHGCGLIRGGGDVRCWGRNSHGQADPPNVRFVALTSGKLHTCGLTAGGQVGCWGYLGAVAGAPVRDTFIDLSAKFELTCGLRPDGSTNCWGGARQGQGTLAGGPYTSIATGGYNFCAINLEGGVECTPNVVTQGGRSE